MRTATTEEEGMWSKRAWYVGNAVILLLVLTSAVFLVYWVHNLALPVFVAVGLDLVLTLIVFCSPLRIPRYDEYVRREKEARRGAAHKPDRS
jgi:uncharacterized membrane protein